MHFDTTFALKRLNELGRLFRKKFGRYPGCQRLFCDFFRNPNRKTTETNRCAVPYPQIQPPEVRARTADYGVSLDISKMMYKSSCNYSLKALEKALTEMQSQGKLLICPEKGCIHITIVN